MNATAFRKKPVEIEAFQMTEARRRDNTDWPEWLKEAHAKHLGEPGALTFVDYPNSTDRLQITTLEGVMQIEWGDWIIRGVKGELYPCKPDIFELTYEAAVPDTFQQRVINEKSELDERGAKLSAFIYDNPIFQGLPIEEQERLNRQYSVMCDYSQVLGERIAAFPA